MSMRLTWMDSLRGLAIVLLLFWHACSIPVLYGWEMPQWLYLLNEVFLPWRMPTLMFLSGVLLERSLRKATGTYLWGKVRAILWPYLVWSAIHLLTFPLNEAPFLSPKSWISTGYLWFLFFLLGYYVIALVVARLPWWAVLPAFAVVALLFEYPLIHNFAYFAVYFFAGHYGRRLVLRSMQSPRKWFLASACVSAAFTVLSVWLTAIAEEHFFQYDVISIPFVLVLMWTSARLVVWADERWHETRPVLAARWVGQRSIVFYLTHFPVMSVVSVLLLAAVGGWVVPIGFSAALVACTVTAFWMRAAPISWFFAAPSFRRNTRPPVTRVDSVGPS